MTDTQNSRASTKASSGSYKYQTILVALATIGFALVVLNSNSETDEQVTEVAPAYKDTQEVVNPQAGAPGTEMLTVENYDEMMGYTE